MKEEKFDIGGLYKDSFRDYKAEPKEFSWYDIDSRVSKMNFYRFSAMNFNIYYGILIVSTFLISVGVGVDHFFISDRMQPQPEQIEMMKSNDIQSKNTIDLEKAAPAKTTVSKPGIKAKTVKQTSSGEMDPSVRKEVTNTGSEKSTNTEIATSVDTQQLAVPPKKTVTTENKTKPVYIYEEDVIIPDTVKVIKKRPSWFNKN